MDILASLASPGGISCLVYRRDSLLLAAQCGRHTQSLALLFQPTNSDRIVSSSPCLARQLCRLPRSISVHLPIPECSQHTFLNNRLSHQRFAGRRSTLHVLVAMARQNRYFYIKFVVALDFISSGEGTQSSIFDLGCTVCGLCGSVSVEMGGHVGKCSLVDNHYLSFSLCRSGPHFALLSRCGYARSVDRGYRTCLALCCNKNPSWHNCTEQCQSAHQF